VLTARDPETVLHLLPEALCGNAEEAA